MDKDSVLAEVELSFTYITCIKSDFKSVLWICGHQIQKVKIKVALEQTTKAQRGIRVIAVLFLTL